MREWRVGTPMIKTRRSHACKSNRATLSFRTPNQVSDRLDKLIEEMKHLLKARSKETEGTATGSPRNILCVAHGHVLSALALRWAEQSLKNGMRLLIDTAGVGVLW